jgi:hypothetical protein
MWQELWEHCKREWGVLRRAPMAFFLAVLFAFLAAWSACSWLYDQRIESLSTTINLYEAKLNVASPDEAYKRMAELNDKLNTALEVASKKFEAIVEKGLQTQKAANYSWMEPICVSMNDTTETKRQILIHNLMGQELKVESFFNQNFCQEKYPYQPKDDDNLCVHPNLPNKKNLMESDVALFIVEQWTSISMCRAMLGHVDDENEDPPSFGREKEGIKTMGELEKK